jgi:hypothetical protein
MIAGRPDAFLFFFSSFFFFFFDTQRGTDPRR